jgi:hypothetical protein
MHKGYSPKLSEDALHYKVQKGWHLIMGPERRQSWTEMNSCGYRTSINNPTLARRITSCILKTQFANCSM